MTITMESRQLAAGPGWFVQDLVCSAGPQDKPFEERHESVAIAAVMSGTFIYRTTLGTGLLAPGAILLGNYGRCFECGHEHGTGDRCISFHFAPDYWEDIVAAVPGVLSGVFDTPSLPPVPILLPVTAALEAAREMGRAAMEEFALDFAGVALRLASRTVSRPHKSRALDERRISEAVRRIESAALDLESEQLSLGILAQDAGISRYHFLRTFRGLVGMTPHQYVLQIRMNRAAFWLLTTDDSVTAIAFRAGFNDLSTFARRFRRYMGTSPGAYRKDRAASTRFPA